MSLDQIFINKVLIPYGITEILTPKNLGNGELKNVILSDLRNELDFCYQNIESYPLKKKLLDYIEDYLIDLKIKIASKKSTIKGIKRKIKNHSNLYKKDTDKESLEDEIDNIKWELQQEKFILFFLNEQQYFIRNWVSQKNVNYLKLSKEKIKKDLNKTLNKKTIQIPKVLPFYSVIGSFFAQNFIYRIPTENKRDFTYFFKKKPFPNPNKLSKYIKEKVLKTDNKVRPYIDDTLKEKGEKNFYTKEIMIENTIAFCKKNKVKIINEKFTKNTMH